MKLHLLAPVAALGLIAAPVFAATAAKTEKPAAAKTAKPAKAKHVKKAKMAKPAATTPAN